MDSRQQFTQRWLNVYNEERTLTGEFFSRRSCHYLLESAKKLVETQPDEYFHFLVGVAEALFPFSQKIGQPNLALLRLVYVVKPLNLHLEG